MSNFRESRDLGKTAQQTHSGEEALVRRAQAGDPDAFADLVRAYQRRAVSVAYRLLGNREDASDVSQDAFVRAYRNLGQLEEPAKFGSWLLRVVSNLSLNFRRGRAAKMTASLDDVLAGGGQTRNPRTGRPMTASSASEKDEMLPEELHGAVTGALAKLPDKQRLALILFSVEGMPQREVAEILQCSVELVKWNVFQARKKLRKMLDEYL